jgi:hypothetical protein
MEFWRIISHSAFLPWKPAAQNSNNFRHRESFQCSRSWQFLFQSPRMSKIVGIDLGTTNSLVATVDSGIPFVIADANGRRLTPSVVHFPSTNENPIVGHEANPSKIVSGFGGTLCLVLSSVYIFASIGLLVFVTMGLHGRASWAIESIAGFISVSFAIGWMPLKFGLRQLKNFEA